MNRKSGTTTEELMVKGVARLDAALNLMYDSEWEQSIIESFNAAQLHLVALIVSRGGDAGNNGLSELLTLIEETNGRTLPVGLQQRSRKLDRIFLMITSGTAHTFGWEEYHDEEQCSNMIHYTRSIVKFCRSSINRANSHTGNTEVRQA